MYCYNCGKLYDDEKELCPVCWSKLEPYKEVEEEIEEKNISAMWPIFFSIIEFLSPNIMRGYIRTYMLLFGKSICKYGGIFLASNYIFWGLFVMFGIYALLGGIKCISSGNKKGILAVIISLLGVFSLLFCFYIVIVSGVVSGGC